MSSFQSPPVCHIPGQAKRTPAQVAYLPLQNTAQPDLQHDVNFEARYKFGNRRRQGINICHWNKGGGYLTNRINEIENVISTFRPHLLGISEANVWKNHDIQDIQIENYNVHLCKSLENPMYKVSRVAVYVHKDLSVKVRNDLMNDSFSIWLEVGHKHQKKILVCVCYREWQYLKQPPDDTSHTVDSQLERWLSFIGQWEQAIATGKEICVLGDFKLNYFHFGTENLKGHSHSWGPARQNCSPWIHTACFNGHKILGWARTLLYRPAV